MKDRAEIERRLEAALTDAVVRAHSRVVHELSRSRKSFDKIELLQVGADAMHGEALVAVREAIRDRLDEVLT